MNKRNLLLLGFAVVVAAQLAVPAWLIIEREWTLREGQVFKFKTQPIDPADAFRGRYVWLNLDPNEVKAPNANQWSYGQRAYAVLATDTNGFALIKNLEHEKPASETAVKVRVRWPDSRKGVVHIEWPGLDRYYMTEKKAPAAETAYREHNRRTNQNCHVTVRVLGTRAVLENLYIENQPIQAWLKAHPAGK
jgi:uncharacterized membrane-anchored protein